MRSHLIRSALLVAAVACGTDATDPEQPPPPPNPAVGTYSIHTVDGARFPIVTVSQDSTCLDIDSGGWLTLFPDGTYATVLSRVSTVCNGRLVGATGIAWRGVYEMTTDNRLVRLARTPPDESFIFATFDQGTYRPGSSGTLPSLRFRDGEHDYVVLADVP